MTGTTGAPGAVGIGVWESGQGCWLESGGSGFGRGGGTAGSGSSWHSGFPAVGAGVRYRTGNWLLPRGTFGRHREGWTSLLGVIKEQISGGLGVGKGIPGKAHWVAACCVVLERRGVDKLPVLAREFLLTWLYAGVSLSCYVSFPRAGELLAECPSHRNI